MNLRNNQKLLKSQQQIERKDDCESGGELTDPEQEIDGTGRNAQFQIALENSGNKLLRFGKDNYITITITEIIR